MNFANGPLAKKSSVEKREVFWLLSLFRRGRNLYLYCCVTFRCKVYSYFQWKNPMILSTKTLKTKLLWIFRKMYVARQNLAILYGKTFSKEKIPEFGQSIGQLDLATTATVNAVEIVFFLTNIFNLLWYCNLTSIQMNGVPLLMQEQ